MKNRKKGDLVVIHKSKTRYRKYRKVFEYYCRMKIIDNYVKGNGGIKY